MDSTNFLDETPENATYEYRIVAIKGIDGEISESIKVNSSVPATIIAMDVPLPVPAKHIQHIVAGDLLMGRRS